MTQKTQNNLISKGAEANIYKSENKVLKDRIPKSYRHPKIDKMLRKRRTKSEVKLIEKASQLIPVPKILVISSNKSYKETQHDNYKITMSYIKGKKLSESLENLDYKKVCKQIGINISKLHDSDIIHGDLTTSNMILCLQTKKVYFIDFGLGFHSHRIEDKAVDLHLIKEALEARHPTIFQTAFKSILAGYKSSKNYQKTIKQLEKVEKRGRYKAQY